MKQFFLILILCILCFQGIAQIHISTNYRIDAVYNSITQKNDITAQYEEFTFFDFNKELTFFTLKTANVEVEFIINTIDVDTINKKWICEVVSQFNKEYTLLVDIANNYVRLVYSENGSIYVIQRTIRSITNNN